LGTFNGHENIVRGICFSPDGLSLSNIIYDRLSWRGSPNKNLEY
jgi:hypothetical protein